MNLNLSHSTSAENAPHSRRALLRLSGEFEMAKNRLAIGFLIFAYLTWENIGKNADVNAAHIFSGSYFLGGLILFASVFFRPEVSTPRRIMAMLIDLGSLSYCLHAGGQSTSILFPVYLWVIFGNGFRFGNRFQFGATFVSLIGFTLMFFYTPFWHSSPQLAIGLFIGLAAIPTYAAKLIRDLNRAKAAAEHASKAKSRFLASISHEFRTPLHAIVGMSDLLLNSDIRPTHRDMLSTVRKSAQSLNSLIDTILDFSRLEAGRMPIKTETFSLDTVLGNVASMLESPADKKQIRLGLTIAPDVPDMVHGSRSSLEAIIINLASNAVKFTSEGNVNILAHLVETKNDVARVRFEVADTGIGIAEDSLETVFEAFSQADDTILDQYGGTGLGLATAKQLAIAQKGAIGVESEPGKGTTFWFELPLEIRPPQANNASTDGPSIIVVSRRAEIIRLLSDPLSAANAATRIADDLDAAQAMVDTAIANGATKPVLLVDHDSWSKATVGGNVPLPDADVAIILVDQEGHTHLADIGDRNRFLSYVSPDAGPEIFARVLRLAANTRPTAADTHTTESYIAKAGKSLKILVADDNRTNRMVVTKILEMAGHKTLTAENGEAMLDQLTETRCDVVLMDVNMPVMNGLEATKHLRVMETGRADTPVIGLTADGSDEMRVACTEAGMNACLTKPVNPPDLLNAIQNAAGLPDVPSQASDQESDTIIIAANDDGALTDGPAVDEDAVSDLIQLGGESFACEVVSSFIGEARGTINRIATSLDRRDWVEFHNQAHALKSTSSNVGAIALAGLCHQSGLLRDDATDSECTAFVKTLKAALEAVIASRSFARLVEGDREQDIAV